jgi:uncharacterized protein (TIGR03435 family)
MRTTAALLMTLYAGAQTPDASAQFEVASIKPSPTDATHGAMSGGPGSKDPGLWTCENINLKNLVIIAYNLPSYRYAGPDWMRSTRFNISAKVPEGATREQFRLMLQSLLIERLKLSSHREQKEMTMYDLVIAKNGHKMKESPPGDDSAPAPRPPGPPKADAEGFPILPPGRQQAFVEIGDNRVAVRWAGETMERFASYLSAQLGKQVDDATGLKGKYDFTMHWADDDAGPTLIYALAEQLGLRLESKKGIIEILVVDHIEKTPTEN